MNKLKKWFGLNTVRNKVLLLSKLAGAAIVIFYIITIELPVDDSLSFLIWFALLAATIIGADYLLGRFISKPLQDINAAARRMAELDFTARCDIRANDEFGELSQNLNAMSLSLEEALAKLETAGAQLEADVARQHLLLDQRKELTDNLSHEMKTPLGIIHAYAEGLKEETDELKRQNYTDVILSAAERMNSMLVSLLDLSALEAGAVTLADECFDFIELVETTAGRLLLDAPNTDFTFTYELPEEKIYLHADRYRMEQVLNNLIGNAGRYVMKGGRIHLSVSVREELLLFTLFNEGTPLPEPELSRIWTKFYRAKAQDTIRGGSGLGLSIVAQILTLYGAEYGVRSHPDGTEFYFTFPV